MEKILNFIGGEWRPAATGRFARDLNPANTDEVLAEAVLSDVSDLHAAVAAAKAAYPAWKNTPAPKRGEVLFRAVEIMRRRHEELARVLTREEGKIFSEAKGEVQRAINILEYCAGEGRRLYGDAVQSELPLNFAWTQREPYGVAAIVTPWNFPVAIPVWKLAPALVTGNTVVFKPSQFSPKSAYNLVKTLEEAGIPPGVVNLVFGEGAEVGSTIIEHPDVHLISFTGSNAVGKLIAVQCAELGKPVSLEMGGKNAITVLDDADLDLALDGVIWSAFGTTGQRCTAASRVIVQASVYDEFAERLVQRTERLRLGNGLDDATDVGPVVNADQLHKIDSYMAIGAADGAKLACGGATANVGPLEKGHFFQPTVFTGATPRMRIAQEEIFGPVTALIRVESLEEAIEVNNGVSYGLSSSIYTKDVDKAFRAVEALDTGLVYVNAGTIGAEVHLPFGGTRGTGNGHREAGIAALETFTEWKSVYIDYSGKLQKAQIDE